MSQTNKYLIDADNKVWRIYVNTDGEIVMTDDSIDDWTDETYTSDSWTHYTYVS